MSCLSTRGASVEGCGLYDRVFSVRQSVKYRVGSPTRCSQTPPTRGPSTLGRLNAGPTAWGNRNILKTSLPRTVNETRRAKPQKKPGDSSPAPVTMPRRVRVAVRVAAVRHVAAPRAPPLRAPDAADGAARARVEGERLRHERVVLRAETVWCGDFRRGRVESLQQARQAERLLPKTSLGRTELSMSRPLHLAPCALHEQVPDTTKEFYYYDHHCYHHY